MEEKVKNKQSFKFENASLNNFEILLLNVALVCNAKTSGK